MGCCGGSVDEGERNYDSTPTGPVKRRGCTDILCLLLFVGFLIGWGIIAAVALIHGDPNKLFNPTDSEGNVCGVGKLETKRYLFYFDLTKCSSQTVLLTGCPTPQVCVEQCPQNNFAAFDVSSDLVKNRDRLICKYNVTLSKYNDNTQLRNLISNGDCAPYYLSSSAVVGRCLPNISNATGASITDVYNNIIKSTNGVIITNDALKEANKLLGLFMSARNVGEMVFADFKSSWWMMVLGIVFAMVLSFVWILLIRIFGGVMVWFSLVAMLLLFSAGCGYSFYKYDDLKDVPGSEAPFQLTTNIKYYLQLRDTWLAFGIISTIFLFFVLLIIIFLRKRICIAIALINESSKAIAHIPASLFFPLFPFIFQVGIIGFWIIVAVFLASMGEPTYRAVLAENWPPQCESMFNKKDLSCNNMNFDPACGQCIFFGYLSSGGIIGIQIYNLFGVLWFLFFLDGMSQMILAGTFASWYWAFQKPKDIPTFPIAASICRTFSYHLGSIAFGSLIIAVVRLVRIFLEFLDHKFKKYADNVVVKCMMCCLKCCFWCLENCLKYINKNAYIMVAIYGKNFCSSAKDAFSLLLRNVLRSVVLDKVTDFLLFIGKLVIVGGLGTLSFFFFSGQIPGSVNPSLNYYFVPVIVIVVGSYMVASAFFSVYEMAVDTIFLCFLEDCERHDGVEKPYFMSKNLMSILGKRNKKKEE